MAHTFGSKARIPATGTFVASNPITASFTCPAGTTVLWVGIVVEGTTQRTGGVPVYDGIPLTQAGTKRDAGGTPENYVEQFYLIGPPTTTARTLSIPNTNLRNCAVVIACATAGAGQLSALDNASGAAGSSTNPTASNTTTAANTITFAILSNGAQTWAPTARSGTQLYDWDAGNWGIGAQYRIDATTGAKPTNWTFATAEDWAISNVSFKEVPPPLVAPTVTTGAATGVTYESATGNGNVTAIGTDNPNWRGIVYSKTSHGDPGNNPPTAYEFVAEEGGSFGTGAFSEPLLVEPGTTYFYRAGAHNSGGYAYGTEVSFTTPAGPVRLTPSANIPAGGTTATTAQLTPPTGKTTSDFQAGKIDDDTHPLAAIDIAAGKYTEYEWSIEIAADAPNGTVYQLRMSSNGIPLDMYALPQITVASVQIAGATAPTITFSQTTPTRVAGAVTITATAPVITFSQTTPTRIAGLVTVVATAPLLTFSNAGASGIPGTRTITSTAPVLTFSVPTPTVQPGGIVVAATAPTMTFGITTPTTVLANFFAQGESDDFNRASLGADWRQIAQANGANAVISSNQVVAATPGSFSGAIRRGVWPSDQTVSAVLNFSSAPDMTQGVFARARGELPSTFNGYFAALTQVAGVNKVAIRKYTNGVASTLTTVDASAFVSGDTLMMTVIGSVISVYRNSTGGFLGLTFDSSFTNGAPGFAVTQTGQSIDDWTASGDKPILLVTFSITTPTAGFGSISNATAGVLTFEAVTPTAVPGVATVPATAPILTFSITTPTRTAGGVSIVATAPVVTFSNAGAAGLPGGRTITATAPVLTFTANTPTTLGALTVPATAPIVTFSFAVPTVTGALTVPATAPILTFSITTPGRVSPITVAATAPVLTFSQTQPGSTGGSAGAASPGIITFGITTPTAVPGGVSIAATAGTVTFSQTTPTAVQGGASQAATAGLLTFSITTPSRVPGGVSIASTAPILTFSAVVPATVQGGVSVVATAPTITFSQVAPARVPGVATAAATANTLTFSANLPTVVPGAVSIGSTAPVLTFSITTPDPIVTGGGAQSRTATAPTITFSQVTPTTVQGPVSQVATAPILTFSITTPTTTNIARMAGTSGLITFSQDVPATVPGVANRAAPASTITFSFTTPTATNGRVIAATTNTISYLITTPGRTSGLVAIAATAGTIVFSNAEALGPAPPFVPPTYAPVYQRRRRRTQAKTFAVQEAGPWLLLNIRLDVGRPAITVSAGLELTIDLTGRLYRSQYLDAELAMTLEAVADPIWTVYEYAQHDSAITMSMETTYEKNMWNQDDRNLENACVLAMLASMK